MVRSTFCKGPSKFIYYRSYNNYNKEQFENVLKQRLVSSSNFEDFFDTFLATLNKYAPLKKTKIRYNHQVFMSKMLRKAVMKRSKLRNTFNKKRPSENWRSYKRQHNICSNILKSTKKTFFETLNTNELNDNRKFWKTVKPFFTDKCKTTNNIILTEKIKLSMTTKKFPTPLTSISQILPKVLNLRESTGKINFENEESCQKIKENIDNETFSFETISKKDV